MNAPYCYSCGCRPCACGQFNYSNLTEKPAPTREETVPAPARGWAATCIVHTPTGPVPACDSHADKIARRPLRLSIASTYDRRKTGDRYSISSRVGGETICDQKPIADPFVRHRVIVHWWDAIKCLLRHGNITVEVSVDGDNAIIEDVLELDENYIGHGSTRRAEFREGIERALSEVAEAEREGEDA